MSLLKAAYMLFEKSSELIVLSVGLCNNTVSQNLRGVCTLKLSMSMDPHHQFFSRFSNHLLSILSIKYMNIQVWPKPDPGPTTPDTQDKVTTCKIIEDSDEHFCWCDVRSFSSSSLFHRFLVLSLFLHLKFNLNTEYRLSSPFAWVTWGIFCCSFRLWTHYCIFSLSSSHFHSLLTLHCSLHHSFSTCLSSHVSYSFAFVVIFLLHLTCRLPLSPFPLPASSPFGFFWDRLPVSSSLQRGRAVSPSRLQWPIESCWAPTSLLIGWAGLSRYWEEELALLATNMSLCLPAWPSLSLQQGWPQISSVVL